MLLVSVSQLSLPLYLSAIHNTRIILYYIICYITLHVRIYIFLSINKECVIIKIFFILIYRNGIAQSFEDLRESEDEQ